MFELVVGQPPFDSFLIDKDHVIRQMIESVGDLPEKWQRKWALMQREGQYNFLMFCF